MTLDERLERLLRVDSMVCKGKVADIVDSTVGISGISVNVGDICTIGGTQGSPLVLSEVVGFKSENVLLAAYDDVKGVGLGSLVRSTGRKLWIPVEDFLIRRIIDTTSYPIDGKGGFPTGERYGVDSVCISPLERPRINGRLTFGIRAIGGILTIGKGQRMGVFAGSGIRKNTLMGMIAKDVTADIDAVALVSECRREIAEFMEKDLGPEGLTHSVLVVTTSDQPAMYRLKCAMVATAVAEYFKDQGKDVLLMIDSLTRFAMAHCETGLVTGEPPVARGYTPGTYSELPKLLECSGNFRQSSTTGIYMVLVEGDDTNEPISNTVHDIIDGHIVLSRELARKDHYPAININASISRLVNDIVPEDHHQAADKIRNWLSVYRQNEDLISIGAYKPGLSFRLDEAVKKMDSVNQFSCQQVSGCFSFENII